MKGLLPLVCASLLVFAYAKGSVPAQKNEQSRQAAVPAVSNQVEVKTDRFSGATTIELKPQTILKTPEQLITISLEAKFDNEKSSDAAKEATKMATESATLYVESLSNVPTDFGDRELHFIIDGKPLKIGESSGGTPERPDKPGYKVLKTFVNSLNTNQLKQLAAGKRIEMRLGKYEFVLDDGVLTHLRGFAGEFVKYAPSGRSKRG